MHALVPGTITLGQPVLVGGASMCVANVEITEQPPVQRLHATASRLLSWEDRTLAATWNPQAGCYDSSGGWQLASVDSSNNASTPAACLAISCGAIDICGGGL